MLYVYIGYVEIPEHPVHFLFDCMLLAHLLSKRLRFIADDSLPKKREKITSPTARCNCHVTVRPLRLGLALNRIPSLFLHGPAQVFFFHRFRFHRVFLDFFLWVFSCRIFISIFFLSPFPNLRTFLKPVKFLKFELGNNFKLVNFF